MSLPVVLNADAEADLDAAAQWYEQQQTGLGTDLVAEVRNTLNRISQLPRMNLVVHRDLRRALVRRFPYSVIYRVHDDRVEVIAVWHNRRDPAGWQARA